MLTLLLGLVISMPAAAFDESNRLVVECPYTVDFEPPELKGGFKSFKPDLKKAVTCQYVVSGDITRVRKPGSSCPRKVTVSFDPASASVKPSPYFRITPGKVSRTATLTRQGKTSCAYTIPEPTAKKPELVTLVALYGPEGQSATDLQYDCSPNGNRVICTRNEPRF